MKFTPTQQGSFWAGIGLWTLAWATFFHVDSFPIIRRFVKKQGMMEWIDANKNVALIITEIFNFGVHGVSHPESVIFALGGTVVNFSVIRWIIPRKLKHTRKIHQDHLKAGVV